MKKKLHRILKIPWKETPEKKERKREKETLVY